MKVKLVALVTTIITLFLFTPSFVSAAVEDTPPPTAADAGTTANVTWLSVDASIVLWVGSVVIPILLGLAFKLGASKKTMALVNLTTSAVWSLLVTATTETGDAVISKPLLMNTIQAFIISVGTLYGFYQPTGIDGKLKETGGIIGPSPAPQPAE